MFLDVPFKILTQMCACVCARTHTHTHAHTHTHTYIYSLNLRLVHHPYTNTYFGYTTRTPFVCVDANSTFISARNELQDAGICRWKFRVFCGALHGPAPVL